jgi:glycosyltransferase involved in cell wall biosynthesis
MTSPLRVLVDGRVMRDSYHGIGRYTHALLNELAQLEVTLIIVSPREPGRLDVGSLSQYETVRLIYSDARVVSLRSQWEMLSAITRERPDVVFIPYHLCTPVAHGLTPVVCILHDCIFERRAKESGERSWSIPAYQACTRLALYVTSILATLSESTRREIKSFYGVSLSPEAVLSPGVSQKFFDAAGRPRPTGLDLPERYILHVGVRRPHKNQQLLVRALAKLSGQHPELGLVLVGSADTRYVDDVGPLVEDLGLSARVRRFERVSEEQLLGLYANASAFAYPSLVEGYGLPLLEAMAAGVPVIASDAEAVREVCGNAALTLPPDDPERWARALAEVTYDPAVATRLRALGQAVAQRHSWASSAERTLRLLHGAAGRCYRGGDGRG